MNADGIKFSAPPLKPLVRITPSPHDNAYYVLVEHLGGVNYRIACGHFDNARRKVFRYYGSIDHFVCAPGETRKLIHRVRRYVANTRPGFSRSGPAVVILPLWITDNMEFRA